MGTYAASVHVRGVALQPVLEALQPLQQEFDLAFTTTTGAEWLSVHADELRFAGEAYAVAKALSKTLGARAVSFALFDDAELICEAFVKGRSAASAAVKNGKRARLGTKEWTALGASAEVLAELSGSIDDATEAAFTLARALGIPEETVLADQGEDKAKAPPKRGASSGTPTKGTAKLSAAVVAEWAQLEEAAKTAGVAVPKLELFLKMQPAFGQGIDDAAVRTTIALLRKALPGAARKAK